MKKAPSNKALIKKLMGDSIEEAFVVSAIEQYCQTVLEDQTDWGNTLINKDLWQVIASNNLRTIEEHYK
jgi:hypothetical protein